MILTPSRGITRITSRPVTDNAPFFFFTLKAGQILGEKGLRHGIDWKVNLGVLVLLLVLRDLSLRGHDFPRAATAAEGIAASVSRFPCSISSRSGWATSWSRSLSFNASCFSLDIRLTR